MARGDGPRESVAPTLSGSGLLWREMDVALPYVALAEIALFLSYPNPLQWAFVREGEGEREREREGEEGSEIDWESEGIGGERMTGRRVDGETEGKNGCCFDAFHYFVYCRRGRLKKEK